MQRPLFFHSSVWKMPIRPSYVLYKTFCTMASFSLLISLLLIYNTPSFPSIEKKETDACFSDDALAFQHFLDSTIRKSSFQFHCAPPGLYVVKVRFLIEKDGTLSRVHTLTHNVYGMEAAVIKAVQSSPRWQPATQNGRLCRTYRMEHFKFWIADTQNL